MSTIKVNKIENTATANGGIAIDSSGHIQADGVQLPSAGAFSSRRININGAMQVAQRNTSKTGITSDGYYTVDRFKTVLSNLGTYTQTQESDAPAGFKHSLKMDCTVHDGSPASGDYFYLRHAIEAQDLQSLAYGTSSAAALTISFYVKSNKTGNATLTIQQKDNSDKQLCLQYSISAASTWEQKTLSIPGDASGVINSDTGSGLSLQWWLNSGSDFTGGSHQTTWATESNADRNASNLGIGGSANDFFQLAGVQLEFGAVATPFEHRRFAEELNDCSRYYQKSYNYSVAPAAASNLGMIARQGDSGTTVQQYPGVEFRQPMRSNPTVTIYSPEDGTSSVVSNRSSTINSHSTNVAVSSIDNIGENGFGSLNLNAATGPAIAFHYEADAEL